jgi:hypothetical protein
MRIGRVLRALGLALAAVAACAALTLALAFGAVRWNGRSGVPQTAGVPVPAPEAPRPRAAPVPQILFGDLHVHTNFSADAHVQGLRARDREPAHPPADACDFARFCSGLDFWSINDHAESLTPRLWRETVAAVRQCNAVAGPPEDPALVTFLGWEWSHQRLAPEEHFGHKNVVLLGTADGEIPARPIASAPGAPWLVLGLGLANSFAGPGRFRDYADFHRYAREVRAVDDCPEGVPVRELPDDCRESATTPEALFAKLADWGLPAVVIPHGLAWGTTNPANADLAVQLRRHDPRFERLLEVYSGHGNSEVFLDFERPRRDAEGRFACPPARPGVTLCCERAAALARARCEDPGSEACEASVAAAVERAARADATIFAPLDAVPGTTLGDWGDCGQLAGAFLPAFDYRPQQSAQYALALGSAGGEAVAERFRLGLIAASDNHRSRPGTGYAEFGRLSMTDGIDYLPVAGDALDGRDSSFYYTGGLTAVHATSRTREAIFDALRRREVYGTSGPRIQLWFDAVLADGTRRPMGSELGAIPVRFEVRALGALESQPGCPDGAAAALPAERLAMLCLGRCHHPGERRTPIERIEVVRIRPQRAAGDAIASRIEDPWRSFACEDAGAGCTVEFADDAPGAEAVYYVRALQRPTPAVNGDPLRCERDADGRCARAAPCGLLADGTPDDCLAPVAERAWSSPIFVTAPAGG